MKKFIFLIALLITATTFAQQGINYKALLKDTNGNVLASTFMNVQFTIHSTSDVGTIVYQEDHNYTTDANGLLILTIGRDASPSVGVFSAIDWAADLHFLQTTITYTGGTINFDATEFMAVPYAKHAATAANVTGLEALDEGNGIGWRLKGRDPANYANIGLHAVDLSFSQFASEFKGASGESSTAMGDFTIASGDNSTAMGFSTRASGFSTTAMGVGTNASGVGSTAMGINTIASGSYATAMGHSTEAKSFAETAIGSYNTIYTPNNTTSWNAADRLFVVGNGANGNESDALTILKNGNTTINGTTTINSTSSDALTINSGNGGFGINLNPGSGTGIFIVSAISTGIHIGQTAVGISVSSASLYGGYFEGVTSGVHAESSNDTNPDLILGGTANTAAGDNGVIASVPTYASSDIFIRSNDAVVVQLNYDNGIESGGAQFEIKDGNQVDVFEVRDSGNATLAGSLTQNSDRRLKKDIEALPYGLKEVLQLQPKAYNWKSRKQEHKSLGLIAQEVQPIIKEIVNASDDEMKTLGISYTELIPVLINAIKEQQEIIKSLELTAGSEKLKVATLESDVSELKTLVQQLIVEDEAVADRE